MMKLICFSFIIKNGRYFSKYMYDIVICVIEKGVFCIFLKLLNSYILFK